MRVHSTRARIALGLPAALLALTALAACGDDEDSDAVATSPTSGTSAGATTATTPAGDAALGPEKKAAGEAVKIGFAYEGSTSAIDTSGQLKAAQAVVKYANERLGGLGGRPIELVTCETKNSPATAQDCGNQFVSEKVLAVTSGSLGQTDPVVKAINAAGISLVDTANTSPSVIMSTTNFSITNPLNPFGGPASLAKTSGITKVALVVIDVPAAIEPAKQIAPLLFGNAGVAVDVVGIAPGVADATPQIQAEEAKKPGSYHVIGNPAFCASTIKAIKTLGLTTPVTGIDRCLDKTSAASIPGGFEGITVFTTANSDPATEEGKLYQAILSTYGGGEPSADTVAGYQGILAMIRAVNAASLTDFTAAGITAAMKAAPATPIPLGDGATFQCDGKAVQIAPAVCAGGGITAVSDEDGDLSGFKTFSDDTIYKAPTK